jgi:predicted CXXCH cytochrome family protein
MGIFSKRFLLPLFFAGIMCVAIFRPDQVVKAAEDAQVINNVSVEITEASVSPPTSKIHLRWQAVLPVNVNGSISYDIVKSTDGGETFESVLPINSNFTNLTWTDNSVPNYTNVIYKVLYIETASGTTTTTSTSSAIKVFPPDINIHDNYMINTDLCSDCHSSHIAKTPNLNNESAAAPGFCITCHDAGATNSKYDVINGNTRTTTATSISLGGAFKNAGSASVSAHSMACTNCHSAHGTESYRMLKSPVIVLAGAKADNTGETAVYISGIDSFCLSCHTDTNAKYTTGYGLHPENAASGASCLECHYSHGSKLDDNLLKPEP